MTAFQEEPTDTAYPSEKLVDTRFKVFEGTGEGSVAKAIDDAVSPLAEVVDNNRLYSDSQYLALKAQADAQALEIQASRAELYNGYKILQFGSTDIIGKGTKADYSAIDVSANVVDGKLSMEQKGLTIRNIVNGASIANLSTVTFATILNAKYYDTLNNAILTGTGSDMTATNNSGATANMAIYHLNAHGLQAITDTAILAKLFPYVDGTKNVGKMGLRVVDDNMFHGILNPKLYPTYPIYSQSATESGPTRAGDLTYKYDGKTLRITNNTSSSNRTPVIQSPIPVPPNTEIALSYNVVGGSWTQSRSYMELDKNYTFVKWTYKSNSIITQPNTMYVYVGLGIGSSYPVTFTNIQLNIGSTTLPYEPYQEQLTFLPAIGNSLPNGVADSIKTVADGWEHSKRVSTPSSVGSGVAVNTTNYPTAKNGSQWVNELTAGGTEIGVIGTDSTTGAGMLRFELATPIVTKYDLPIPTSGKTIHRFAGEEKIALYGTGVTFSENVLSVLSAVKFVSGVMTDITSLATITTNTVTFSGVNATDVVYVKVEHSVNRPLGILEHTPAVSNTASRLASLEARVSALEV